MNLIMLKLFIIKSDSPNADAIKTINSFDTVITDFQYVTSYQEINDFPKTKKYFCVLYDNEYLDKELAAAIKVIVKSEYDYLVLFKKHAGKYYEAPRMFKKELKLKPDSLIPENYEKLIKTSILDGWILEC